MTILNFAKNPLYFGIFWCWSILSGLKTSKKIVWPSGGCRKLKLTNIFLELLEGGENSEMINNFLGFFKLLQRVFELSCHKITKLSVIVFLTLHYFVTLFCDTLFYIYICFQIVVRYYLISPLLYLDWLLSELTTRYNKWDMPWGIWTPQLHRGPRGVRSWGSGMRSYPHFIIVIIFYYSYYIFLYFIIVIIFYFYVSFLRNIK